MYERTPITDEKQLETIRLSPSSINTYRTCPKKWHYEYILARISPQTLALARGTIVHYALEELFKQRFVPAGEPFRPHMHKYIQKLFNSKWTEIIPEVILTKKEQEDLSIIKEESELMLTRFVDRFCDKIQEGIKISKYQNETQGYYFTRPTFKELWLDDQEKASFNEKWKRTDKRTDVKEQLPNPLIVGGFIDSVQKNFDNELILVDYKTSTKYKESINSEYILQLAIYAYLWLVQTGKMPDYVAIKYLKYDETIMIKVNTDLIKDAIRKIKHMRQDIVEDGINGDNYVKHESKLCDWCFYKKECLGIEEAKAAPIIKQEVLKNE